MDIASLVEHGGANAKPGIGCMRVRSYL
jgi:hypothetical protein